jgi:hypothetical protein
MKRTPDSELKEELRIALCDAQDHFSKCSNDLDRAEANYELLKALYTRFNRIKPSTEPQ